MRPVPLRILRVSYVYGFRFTNITPNVLACLADSTLEGSGLLLDFRTIDWNSAEGFQPYVKMKSDTISVSTHSPVSKGDNRNCYINNLAHEIKDCGVYQLVDSGDQKHRKQLLTEWKVGLHRAISINNYGLGTYCITLYVGVEDDSFKAPWARKQLLLSECLDLLNVGEKPGLGDQNPWRYAISNLNDSSTKGPSTAIPLAVMAAVDLEEFRQYASRLNALQIQWLCRDGDGANTEALVEVLLCGGDKVPFQNPYVYFEGEAASVDDYKEFIRKDHSSCGEQRRHEGILQKMLIRVGSTGIEEWGVNLAYLHKHGACKEFDQFPNYYPCNYLFINAHFRSTLAIFPPLGVAEFQPVTPAIDSFLLALRDTVREVRARWFYLVMEHAYVDALLKRLRSAWDMQTDWAKLSYSVQKSLLECRFNVGRILEAPVVYRRAASSLNEVYCYLRQVLGMDALEKSLIQKLRQTIDIYDECLRIKLSDDHFKRIEQLKKRAE